eukprot:Amastigsp_a181710_158.p2 type:complete len:170 gc:universal Amastigsp_a181710_158:541-32(-)
MTRHPRLRAHITDISTTCDLPAPRAPSTRIDGVYASGAPADAFDLASNRASADVTRCTGLRTSATIELRRNARVLATVSEHPFGRRASTVAASSTHALPTALRVCQSKLISVGVAPADPSTDGADAEDPAAAVAATAAAAGAAAGVLFLAAEAIDRATTRVERRSSMCR